MANLQSETPSLAGSVLIADDDVAVGEILRRLLVKGGFTVDVVHDGLQAIEMLTRHGPDVVLLDVQMPSLDGLEVCRRLKQDPAHRLTPVVLITGMSQRDVRIEGLEAGADEFLTKPIDAQELLARVRSLARIKRYTDDLDSAASFLMAIAVLIEARDGNTEGHCHRMANYAAALGRALGLNEEALQALRRGGFLHDIGMLAIPNAVLTKPGPLDSQEFELMKSHTVVGDSLCGMLKSLEPVRAIVRYHHERYDGSGYPDGLRGDAIPLVAQIIGLVDVYDAVTTQRPYQGAHSSEQAVDILRGQVVRGRWREDLVEAFAGLVESGRLDTYRP